MASTGRHFPLHAFEVAALADTDILGVLYTGSLGAGMADRYSDLDIEVWVTDRAWADGTTLVRRLMERLGAVQFLYERGEGFVTGFVGPDWQRVDLEVHRGIEARQAARYARARVIKDVDGRLARLVAEAPREEAGATWERARVAIEEAIDSQIYLTLHNARGAVWSAMGEISYRCAELYTLLALLRGRQSFGFRSVEQVLSPAERELLREAWPKEAEQEEVHRAGRALWRWTRYVWDEAERVLGRSLGIEIDEAGLPAAVERIYSRRVRGL